MKLDGLMLTKKKFSKMIEETVRIKRIPYMDAIILICEKNSLEVEDIKKYLNEAITNKVEVEAMDLNYLPRSNKLPI